MARFADSTGYEQDYDRANAWRYRDYVIKAFNQDKPYNLFIKEQIAGDELDYTTDETRIATGFLRAGPRVQFREKDNPERRHEYLDDVLATVGRGILGLTVHCARCHNHKFDPIPQADYYSLQASIFGYVETEYPLLSPEEMEGYRQENGAIDALQQPLKDAIEEIEAPYRERLKLERLQRDFPENVVQAVLKPDSERTPGEQLLAVQVLSVGVRAPQLEAALAPDDAERRQVLKAGQEIAGRWFVPAGSLVQKAARLVRQLSALRTPDDLVPRPIRCEPVIAVGNDLGQCDVGSFLLERLDLIQWRPLQ